MTYCNLQMNSLDMLNVYNRSLNIYTYSYVHILYTYVTWYVDIGYFLVARRSVQESFIFSIGPLVIFTIRQTYTYRNLCLAGVL